MFYGVRKYNNGFEIKEFDSVNELEMGNFDFKGNLNASVNYIKNCSVSANKIYGIDYMEDSIRLVDLSDSSEDEKDNYIFIGSLSVVASALFNEFNYLHSKQRHYKNKL